MLNSLRMKDLHNSLCYNQHIRAKTNGQQFLDDILKYIFLNENVGIMNKIWLKFVPKGQNDNDTALVQIMAWRLTVDKPLPEPMMA